MNTYFELKIKKIVKYFMKYKIKHKSYEIVFSLDNNISLYINGFIKIQTNLLG